MADHDDMTGDLVGGLDDELLMFQVRNRLSEQLAEVFETPFSEEHQQDLIELLNSESYKQAQQAAINRPWPGSRQ